MTFAEANRRESECVGSLCRPHNGAMNATDRAYRNIEILLARAAGATTPEISKRFGLEERQIRRILKKMRATRRGQDIEAAHQLAESRLTQLYMVIDLQMRALDEISNPFTCITLSDTTLAYFREIREVEELLGRLPREIDWKFKGSDAGWLWMRFKSVIQRHPGAWHEFHDDLYSEYADWVQGQLQRQGNRGHKSLGKMSGFRAKTRPPATIQPSLEEVFRDRLLADIQNGEVGDTQDGDEG
jgi:hypothetical protein